jgi:transposase
MSLGRQRERQADMLVSSAEMPRSPGHVFYDELQAVLIAAAFDALVETQRAKECASPPAVVAARSLLPHAADRYFRGIDSERGLECCCGQPFAARVPGSV